MLKKVVINIKEFRNNFCNIAEATEAITVTKRGRVIGYYTPVGAQSIQSQCERFRLNKVDCKSEAESMVRITHNGSSMEVKLCGDCLNSLRGSLDEETKLEVL
jgi:hypothetical protein